MDSLNGGMVRADVLENRFQGLLDFDALDDRLVHHPAESEMVEKYNLLLHHETLRCDFDFSKTACLAGDTLCLLYRRLAKCL